MRDAFNDIDVGAIKATIVERLKQEQSSSQGTISLQNLLPTGIMDQIKAKGQELLPQMMTAFHVMQT